MQELTQERLKELLHFNPETGIFTWIRPMAMGRIKAGTRAGNVDSRGYVSIYVDVKLYKAHRLAFLYMNGSFPDDGVDHIDCDPSNNAWVNLRAATQEENMGNQRVRKNNKMGLKGVSPHGKKFRATIYAKGKQYSLGTFPTPEEAHEAYAKAANDNFGEFARAV